MKRKIYPVIDLHGRTVDEVFDLLDSFIRKNQRQERIMVIVGKGRGIIKKKVLEYLKMAHYSWVYERSGGVSNPGALLVDLE